MEITRDVVGSVVEGLGVHPLVSFEFVSINSEVNELKDLVFKANDSLSVWVEVEWHMLVSSNIQEVHVGLKEWSEDWLLLEVTPPGLHVEHV